MKLAEPRRCHFFASDRCSNYVNMKRPRRVYWEREKAERVCWAYVCDLCLEKYTNEDWYWPTAEDGRFKQTMECSLP